VLERLGAPPEHALHVGNVPHLDVAGARAAGVDALLVDRPRRLDGRFYALRDLTRLPEIVERGLPDLARFTLESRS
jgi:FMN phosphatase YigB (HAD superfamily)